jgi:hypothetical protein
VLTLDTVIFMPTGVDPVAFTQRLGTDVAARSPYIDGEFVEGDAGTFAVFDPATEESIAEVEGYDD